MTILKSCPHRTRQRCFGLVCHRLSSASRPVPSRQNLVLTGRGALGRLLLLLLSFPPLHGSVAAWLWRVLWAAPRAATTSSLGTSSGLGAMVPTSRNRVCIRAGQRRRTCLGVSAPSRHTVLGRGLRCSADPRTARSAERGSDRPCTATG